MFAVVEHCVYRLAGRALVLDAGEFSSDALSYPTDVAVAMAMYGSAGAAASLCFKTISNIVAGRGAVTHEGAFRPEGS